MAKLKIHTLPDEILRKKAQEVTHIDKKAKKLIKEMAETMASSNGIGIAAPQVGKSLQIIVIELKGGKRSNGEDMPTFPRTVCINPTIIKKSKEKEWGEEGCLSVPELWGSVERYKKIEIVAQDEKGKKINIEASDLLARVFQHEIDHLNGIVFTDKVDYKTLHKIGPDGKKIPFEL